MQASYIDTNMLFEVNKNFCTQNCPCDESLYNLGYTDVSEEKFNFNGRTKAATQGKIPITTSNQPDAMKSWEECWTQRRRDAVTDKTLQKNMDSYIKAMKALEPRFKCSGACVSALFWFTQPISSAPSVGCLYSVTD